MHQNSDAENGGNLKSKGKKENTVKANKAEKTSYFRPLFVGTAIFAVIVLHFAVSQFIAFESEKTTPVTELINVQPVEIKPEYKTPKVEKISDAAEPEINQVESKTAPKQASAKQTVVRKKEVERETRAERLRRAEKILTGV